MNKIGGARQIHSIYVLRMPNAFYLTWVHRSLRSEHVIIVMFAASFLYFGLKRVMKYVIVYLPHVSRYRWYFYWYAMTYANGYDSSYVGVSL